MMAPNLSEAAMFVRVKSTPKSPRKSVQICENVRSEGKVKQSVVRHVGIAQDEEHLLELKQLAKVLIEQIKEERNGPFLFPLEKLKEDSESIKSEDEPIDVKGKELSAASQSPSEMVDIFSLKEEKRVVEGFHEVFGTLFHQLGFDTILSKKQSEALRDVVLARIASPGSKLHTGSLLAADFGREVSVDRIYRMMDLLTEKKSEFQTKVFEATESLCFGQVELVLFDVTTLYFESVEEDDLRAFGYSKDQKFHNVQVVLALATTSDGLPVGYHLFPGNVADVSTLLVALDHWKQTLPIGRVVVVADRAMMSEKNLEALEEAKIDYVVAAKLRKLKKGVLDSLLSSPISSREDGICLDSSLLNRRRLIVTYTATRARKDRTDRERMVEKMEKRIGKGKDARALISNQGYKKFTKTEGDGRLVIDQEKLEKEELWDGFHGIITNMQNEEAGELLSHYRRLWVIEESFRIQKHNLAMRPIYHFKKERIEGHILICYLAFTLMRHLEFRFQLQQSRVSMLELKEHLWRVQASYLRDEKSGKRYRLPSSFEFIPRKIYQILGLHRNQRVESL